MTWNVITNDNFARANAAPSANPGSVGNGWIDNLGSIWGINSNMLTGTTSDGNGYKDGDVLIRQSSENAVNQRISATFTYTTVGTTPRGAVILRFQDNSNMIFCQLSNSGGGTFSINTVLGGTLGTAIASTTAVAATSGHSYTLDVSVTGASPTAVSATITDNGTTGTATITGSVSAAALQNAGAIGVAVFAVTNGTSATINYTDLIAYSYSSATNTMGIVPVTTQSANYTFALTDAGDVVDFTGSSAGMFTIPTNASVNFALGTVIGFRYTGTGALTVSGASGVTTHGTLSLTQYQTGFAHQIATDVWVFSV